MIGPFHDNHRDIIVNTVAPEPSLVLGGAALFGAFPLADSVIIEALTIPLSLMLIALIFCGIAFEFRFHSVNHHRKFWTRSFMIKSICATLFQGVLVGSIIQGFEVKNRIFVSGQLG